MSITSLSLQNFLQSVPCCSIQTRLEEVLTIFNSGEYHLVAVVDENQSPVGAIYCRSLIPYLRNFQNFSTGEIHFLMQPMAILPAYMSLKEFCTRSKLTDQLNAYESIALVDSSGKFQGILNNWSLLQLLTQPQSAMDSFLDILEQVSLPMMLETATGETVYQNKSWWEQLGDETLNLKPMTNKWQKNLNNLKVAMGLKAFEVGKVTQIMTEEKSLKSVMESVAFSDYNHLNPIWEPNYPQLSSNVCTLKTDRHWELFKFPLNLANSEMWLVIAINAKEKQNVSCLDVEAKNADLTQLNQVKDDFLAAIAHELKSPVTSILGLSSLLKDHKLGELNQRQTRYVELIYRSGRQLMTLVNDIVDLTLLETGKLKLNKRSVNIKTICEQAYDSIKEEQIEFILEIEPSLEMIIADELRLRQMLVHLLEVPLKFTEAGGKIGLRVNFWSSWVAFTVWDTGIGIPEASQSSMFKEFQQLDSPLSNFETPSSALGLVLTQRLALAHGGDVSFISQVGKGSEFTLLLPSEQRINVNSYTNKLVLIVEAVAGYIENLHGMLRDLGYQVVIARSGTEALEKARKLQPALIFLNPTLPQLSGWDVLTLLKSDVTQIIPIIITSYKADKQKALENGATGFLSLPIEKQALKRLIKEAIEMVSTPLEDLTILCLHPEPENIGWVGSSIYSQLDFVLSMQSCRILEADDLDQAELLTRVWEINVVIIDGKLEDPLGYLQTLSEYDSLAKKPLITLDEKTTEAANLINGLSVFPCLIPVAEQSFDKLLQVIQIAARFSE